ncbi:MAG: flavoprotein [Rhizobiales bacterium]|nr:flavoprotein [Hyphomicrobiales bacterium]
MTMNDLPIAVIGAGPVGLAAAAHLFERNLVPVVFEAGRQAGSAISQWSHVHLFSPWKFNIDAASRALLEAEHWQHPDPEVQPTGGQLVEDYIAPLAAHPKLAPHIRYETTVVAISRLNRSRLDNADREKSPFVVIWNDRDGNRHRTLARAVIDASGTWHRPNPMGRDGLAVEGEHEYKDPIAYGIPDVLGKDRDVYAGKHTLVVGAGHSAINAVLDLLDLKIENPQTRISWATRSGGTDRLIGGGLNDALPGRGLLGHRAANAVRDGGVSLLSPFTINKVERKPHAFNVAGELGADAVNLAVDRLIVATGFRPDFSFLSELRLTLDPVVEATPALAPLIDPNFHSCGTVRPHGAVELAHPEPGFYIVGMKSYGRAPTFLLATGYEQVRSVVAMLARDEEAALRVELELPETGICRTATAATISLNAKKEMTMNAPVKDEPQAAGCCGGPAPAGVEACCVKDADAKAAGESGCGCGSKPSAQVEPKAKPVACCD